MNRHQRRAQEAQARKETGNGSAESPLSGLGPSVTIGIPSQETWHAKFGMSLLLMFLDSMTQEVPEIGKIERVRIHNIQGSTIWQQRHQLIQLALEDESTHLLFLDCDQTFPPSTLRRLLFHRKAIAACNIATKQIPSIPTARKLVNGTPMPVFTTPESKGIERVWRIGTGIMLVDLSIIDALDEPWFKVSSSDEGEHYGEDWWFCQQVEKAGFHIYIDHDLSWQVGHIGNLVYGHEHIPQEVIDETNAIILEGTDAERGALHATLKGRIEAQ